MLAMIVSGAWATVYDKGDKITDFTNVEDGQLVIFDVQAKGGTGHLWYTAADASTWYTATNYCCHNVSHDFYATDHVWKLVKSGNYWKVQSAANENAYLPVGNGFAPSDNVALIEFESITSTLGDFVFHVTNYTNKDRQYIHINGAPSTSGNGEKIGWWEALEDATDASASCLKLTIYKATKSSEENQKIANIAALQARVTEVQTLIDGITTTSNNPGYYSSASKTALQNALGSTETEGTPLYMLVEANQSSYTAAQYETALTTLNTAVAAVKKNEIQDGHYYKMYCEGTSRYAQYDEGSDGKIMGVPVTSSAENQVFRFDKTDTGWKIATTSGKYFMHTSYWGYAQTTSGTDYEIYAAVDKGDGTFTFQQTISGGYSTWEYIKDNNSNRAGYVELSDNSDTKANWYLQEVVDGTDNDIYTVTTNLAAGTITYTSEVGTYAGANAVINGGYFVVTKDATVAKADFTAAATGYTSTVTLTDKAVSATFEAAIGEGNYRFKNCQYSTYFMSAPERITAGNAARAQNTNDIKDIWTLKASDTDGQYYLFNTYANMYLGQIVSTTDNINMVASTEYAGKYTFTKEESTDYYSIKCENGDEETYRYANLNGWQGTYTMMKYTAASSSSASGSFWTIVPATDLDACVSAFQTARGETASSLSDEFLDIEENGISTGLGYYTNTEDFYNAGTAIYQLDVTKNAGTVVDQDIYAYSTAKAAALNLPQTDHFYKFMNNDQYITAPGTTGTVFSVTTESANSIFYYQPETNHLLVYNTGYYANGKNHALLGNADTYTFNAGKSYGTLQIKPSASNPWYNNNGTLDFYSGVNDGNSWTVTEVTELPITVTDANYATACFPVAIVVPEDDMVGVATKVVKDIVVSYLDADAVVPANTGLIIKKFGGANLTFNTTSETGDDATTSVLTGVVAAKNITTDDYVFAKGAEGVGFYSIEASTTKLTLGGHKAYLAGDDAPEARSFYGFAEETTGINALDAAVNASVKNGKYINNGRMVIVNDGKKFNVAGQAVK